MASVINPVCLGCAWFAKEARQHEFASSGPRARRATAPSRVFTKYDLSSRKLIFLTGDRADTNSNRPEAPLNQSEFKAPSSVIDFLPILSSQSPHMPVDQTTFDVTAVDLHQDRIDKNMNYTRQQEVQPVSETLYDVATATRSVWGKKPTTK